MEMSNSTEVSDALAARGVERIRVIHADPHGRPRSKDFPLDLLPGLMRGIGFCEASLVEGLDGEPLMDEPHPGGHGLPDIHSVPDLASARQLPWDPATAWLLADLIGLDHNPSPLCARSVLRRELERSAALGYSAVTASEPEFYLLRSTDAGYERYSPLVGMAYTSGRRADPDGIMRRIHDYVTALGLGTTAMHREFSPGQFEINISHGEAMDATDRAFLFKESVKELASMEGLLATFMAKPFANAEGSSHHVHLSLWSGETNVFAEAGGGLSEIGHAFAAGLVAHAPAITAIAAPTINSYKRLGGAGLAPTVADAAGDDRTAYLRVPPQWGDATRVELRIGQSVPLDSRRARRRAGRNRTRARCHRATRTSHRSCWSTRGARGGSRHRRCARTTHGRCHRRRQATRTPTLLSGRDGLGMVRVRRPRLTERASA